MFKNLSEVVDYWRTVTARWIRPNETSRGKPFATDGGKQIPGVTADSGAEPATGDGSGSADAREAARAFPLDFYDIMHLVKAPLFVLDSDGEVVLWNEGMAELTGSTEAEAKAADTASQAWYHDGRRSKTLADKVIDAPERAASEYDVERLSGFDFTVYQDSSTFADANGMTRHITFSAAPMYEDGEFVGVVEFVEDRTADVKQQQELETLVDEITDAMGKLERGDLGARASVPEVEHLNDELFEVIHAFNRMGEQLEEIVAHVGEQTDDVRESAEEIAEKSDEITDVVHDQRDSLEQVSSEVNNMSATIEEIASTTDGVAETADETVTLAEDGNEVADEAGDTMSTVAETSEDVMTDVVELRNRVDEIDEIVEVINEIAEQTNILALNASIEAARVGDEGEGFAIVADEVKTLAEESQTQAAEIETTVNAIQDDTEDTVTNLREMNDEVERGYEKVQSARGRFEDIVASIKETADGIEEVSDATDDQATSTEEIASMLDNVVDRANEVSDAVDNVASANDEHRQKASEIEQTIQQLSGDES